MIVNMFLYHSFPCNLFLLLGFGSLSEKSDLAVAKMDVTSVFGSGGGTWRGHMRSLYSMFPMGGFFARRVEILSGDIK